MPNIAINDVPQRIQYSASAPTQSVFPVPFPFMANSDIIVYQDDVLLAQGSGAGQYGLTGAGTASGGTMTLVTAVPTGTIITILGAMPVDRTSIYSPTISNLTGNDLNTDFNDLVIMVKQLQTEQQFLQLQYAPYAEVSQDLSVTTDRWIPRLGSLQVWQMNEAADEIIATTIPAYPTGSVGGDFTASGLFVVTDISQGNNLDQTNILFPVDTPTTGDVMKITGTSGGNFTTEWTAAGDGDVDGPASATDNAYARYDGTTGKIIKNSQTTEDDSGNVTFAADVTLDHDPTANLQAATKQYVDSQIGILAVQSVSSGTYIDVDNTDPLNPVVNVDATAVNVIDFAVLQDGSPIYGADSVGTDAYAITLSPAPASYVEGMEVRFKAGTANTSAATLNVNGLGAVAIKKLHDQDLATGDIEAGQIVIVVYDGTVWQMMSEVAQTSAPANVVLNDGSPIYAATATGNDTYVVTLSPALGAYTNGFVLNMKVDVANTGPATVNVNGLGAVAITKLFNQPLVTGDILANQIVSLVYNSTGPTFQMQSQGAATPITQTGAEIYGLDASGTDAYAITLVPALAAYVTGMTVVFKAGTANTGAATLNVNGLGAKTIKKQFNVDLSTGDIVSGQMVTVVYDGTNFELQSLPTTSGGGSWVKILAQTASSSATIDFTGLDSTYKTYAFVFDNLLPATNQVDLWVRTSTNGGVSYDSGASDYNYTSFFTVGGSNGSNSGGTVAGSQINASIINGSYGISNVAGNGYNSTMYLYDPSATNQAKFTYTGQYETAGAGAYICAFFGSGYRASFAAINAVRFLMSSGNIASGTITMYGLL